METERDSAAVRVLLRGSDPLARAGLRSTLSTSPTLEIVGEQELDADEPPPLSGAEVEVWDWGLVASSAVPRLPPAAGVPVLVLLSDGGAAREALALGARGLLYRNAPARQIASAVQALAAGLVSLEPGLLPALLSPAEPLVADSDALTQREGQVLELLAIGLTNKEIAQRLRISEHTAKFHVNAVLSKLGVQSRTEAVVRAARLGLLTL